MIVIQVFRAVHFFKILFFGYKGLKIRLSARLPASIHFTLMFLLFSAAGVAQSGDAEPLKLKPTPDNFERVMAIKNPTTRQVDSIIQLSIEYSYTNQDTCIILGDRSVEISKNHPDRAIHAKALLELGDTYRIFGNREEGAKLIREGRAIYESLKNTSQLAYADNKLGALSLDEGDYEKALEYFLRALNTWEKLKDSSNLVNPCINIGHVFWILKRYGKSDEYNEKALQLAEIRKEDRPKMYVLNNQSLNYKATADDYVSRADTALNAAVLRDSALLFYKISSEKLEQTLALAEKLNDKQSIIRVLINMADIKDELGEHREAIRINKEAELLSQALGDPILMVLIKRNMAEAYRHAGQYNLSVKYGNEGLQLARTHELEGYEQGINEQLYPTYKAMGLYEKALETHESMLVYMKKNNSIDFNKAVTEVEEKYQNAQKQRKILEQKNSILELESAKASVEKQRNMFIGGSLFLAIAGFFGFKINQVRKERNEKRAFAEALIFAQEEERKRISRDLHDGIGQSLLLLKKQLDSTDTNVLNNQKLISETLEEVRTISRDLHPFQLEKFGLTLVIHDTVQRIAGSTNIFISKSIDNIDGQLPEKAEIHLFRTIQEALNNIVKHSEATAAQLTVTSKPDEIQVVVQDNGKGFDYELKMVKSKSLGLHTMFERIAAIGGKLKISPGKPGGTVVTMTVPRGSRQ